MNQSAESKHKGSGNADRPQRGTLIAFFGHLGMIAGRPKMESVTQSVMNITEKAEVLIAFFLPQFSQANLASRFPHEVLA